MSGLNILKILSRKSSSVIAKHSKRNSLKIFLSKLSVFLPPYFQYSLKRQSISCRFKGIHQSLHNHEWTNRHDPRYYLFSKNVLHLHLPIQFFPILMSLFCIFLSFILYLFLHILLLHLIYLRILLLYLLYHLILLLHLIYLHILLVHLIYLQILIHYFLYLYLLTDREKKQKLQAVFV